jgi:hypothetical protein
MEAAGGVKTTLEDLTHLYKAYLQAIVSQSDSSADSAPNLVFKCCRTIVSGFIRFPNLSLREQTYAAGGARGELGQLDQVSVNPSLGDETIIGKSAESRLVVYHHGCMPGSLSALNLIPETETAIIALQKSLAPIDVADFNGQLLVEAVCDVPQPNDYRALAREFTKKGFQHLEDIKAQLDRDRHEGTKSKTLGSYTGRYWNEIKNFYIGISEHDFGLRISFQGVESENTMWNTTMTPHSPGGRPTMR